MSTIDIINLTCYNYLNCKRLSTRKDSMNESIYGNQDDLRKRLFAILRADPRPLREIGRHIGIAPQTLKKFMENGNNNSERLLTLLHLEKFIEAEEARLKIGK